MKQINCNCVASWWLQYTGMFQLAFSSVTQWHLTVCDPMDIHRAEKQSTNNK